MTAPAPAQPARVYLPGDAFTVGLVRESWQRPGLNRQFLRSVKGQLWERVAERTPSGKRRYRHGALILPRLADERGPRASRARWAASGVIRAGRHVR